MHSISTKLARNVLKYLNVRCELPRFNVNISGDTEELIITIPQDVRMSYTTILGGRLSEEIRLQRKDVDRLPHNLIHAALTDIPEGKMIQGKTPDIVFEDDCFIEISTTRSPDEEDLINSLTTKRLKYESLKMDYAVIAVGPFLTICQPDFLLTHEKIFLSKLLRYGHQLQDDFYKVKGCPRSTRIYVIPWRKVDPDFKTSSIPKISDIPPINQDLNLSKYETKRKSFNAYVHVPLFIGSIQDDNDFEFDPDHPHFGFLGPLTKMKTYIAPDLRQLNEDSKKGKTTKTYLDQFKVSKHLLSNFKIRGLNAKSSRSLEIKIHSERKKEPYSLLMDHSRLKGYLSELEPNESDIRFNVPLDKIRGHSMVEEARELSRIPLVCAAHDYELCLREICLNAKRYTPKDEFIYRKVPNRPIFVIMKSTGYNKVGDDRPIFYIIVYKGRPYAPGIYGNHSRIGKGWFMTEMISTDKRRLEHLIGLPEQLLVHYKSLESDLRDQPHSLMRSFKLLSLILIANSSKLSETCQILRYYYMKIYSGMPTTEALSTLNKWPETIRSPLQSYVMQEVLNNHPKSSKRIIKRPMSEDIEDKADDSMFIDLMDRQDDLDELATPFGFSIMNGKTFLRSSYMCMLYNKNRQNLGHDSKLIFSKLLKNEIEFLANDSPILIDHQKASDYRKFQASPAAIKKYSWILLKKLSRNLNNDIMKSKCIALEHLLSDDVYSLLSTKSSSTASGETMGEEYDRRSKVFIELIKLSQDSLEPCLMDNLPMIREKWQGHSTVSLFKKNQIGGTREIYILDILSRLRFRIIESLSRGFCLQSDNEMLTHPTLRQGFVHRHSRACADEFKGESYRTLRFSGDMTNWANLLMMDYFEVMFSVLMPEHFGLIKDILDTNRKKRIYAPETLIKSFEKNPNTQLLDPNVQAFKDVFLGKSKNQFAKENRPYVENKTNMMQGILHYTSSLYHLVHMEMLTDVLKESISKITGSKVIISHEVSSDDEGMLISFMCPDIKSHAKRIIQTFWSCKLSVDNIFGVRTSIEKSTLSVQNIYEFNSTFHFMNNVLMPGIKFISRVIDDNPSETLRQRVSSLHSSLRQMREAGCDGELTHFASLCQLSLFSKNMGFGTMSWDSPYSPYCKSRLSSFGAYYVHPPWISGLVTSDYDDWIECFRDPNLLKLYITYSIKDVLVEEQSGHSMTYRLWPRRKYDLALKSLGIDHDKKSLGVNRVLLTKYAQSKEDLKMLFSNYATDPGIAKSFSWLSRNECVQLSAFAQWGLKFEGLSYFDILQNDRPETSDETLSLEACFPESSQFARFFEIETTKYRYVKLRKEKSQNVHSFYPIIEKDKIIYQWKKALDRRWFKTEFGILNQELETLFDSLCATIKWLKSDANETVEASPFDNLVQVIMFFEATLKKPKPMHLLSSGRFPDITPLESLIRYNTKCGYRAYSDGTSDDASPEIKVLKDVESRFSAWSDVLRACDPSSIDETIEKMSLDMKMMLSAHEIQSLELCLKTGSERQKSFAYDLFASLGIIDFKKYLQERPGDLTIYLSPQKRVLGEWQGSGDIYVKYSGQISRMKLQNDSIVSLISEQGPVFWERYAMKFRHQFSPQFSYTKSAVAPGDEKLSLMYLNGFRVRVGDGYTQRFGTDCYPKLTDISVPFDSDAQDSLNIYFNAGTFDYEDLKVIHDSDDPIAESICALIKELRKNQIPLKLRERYFTFEPTVEHSNDGKSLFEIADEMLDDLAPQEEYKDEMLGEVWDCNWDDELNMMAYSAFIQEPFIQSGSFNPTLIGSVSLANAMVKLGLGQKFEIDTDAIIPKKQKFRSFALKSIKIN